MSKPRSYNLLCPIARALDAIGDRWSLLILRDLHAGPTRFSDLQAGLVGIASNLLTDRLTHLRAEGFLEKVQGPHGTSLYQLTETGRATRALLFELAMIGGRLEPVPAPKQPGNLRTIAVTLAAALERVAPPDLQVETQLVVDGEVFTIRVAEGQVEVFSAPAPTAPITLTTTYPALMAVSSGQQSVADFVAGAATLTGGTPQERDGFMTLMESAMAQMQ